MDTTTVLFLSPYIINVVTNKIQYDKTTLQCTQELCQDPRHQNFSHFSELLEFREVYYYKFKTLKLHKIVPSSRHARHGNPSIVFRAETGPGLVQHDLAFPSIGEAGSCRKYILGFFEKK